MAKGRTFFLLALVILAIVVIFYLARQPAPTETTSLDIGVVLSLTGKGATYGERALNGMQLAADELNSGAGPAVRLVVEDSQSSASDALTAFRKLIDINKVPVVTGLVLSDEVLTCAPVANEREVVLLSTAAGSDKIRDAGDFVFRLRESSSLQTEAIAEAATEQLGFAEFGILHSNAANGLSYRDSFQEAVTARGAKVAATVGYNEGKTDYRAEIERLRDANVPVVFLAGLDRELGLILKQAFEVGFRPQFLATAGAISETLLQIAGVGAEGLICGSAPFDPEASDELVRNFAKAYSDRHSVAPDFIAANSYDAVRLLTQLFRSGQTTPSQIKEGLYATSDFPGAGGTVTFDSDGEVRKPIRLVQVRDAEFAPFE